MTVLDIPTEFSCVTFQVCMDFLNEIIVDGMNDRPVGHPGDSMNAYEEVSPIFFKVLSHFLFLLYFSLKETSVVSF